VASNSTGRISPPSQRWPNSEHKGGIADHWVPRSAQPLYLMPTRPLPLSASEEDRPVHVDNRGSRGTQQAQGPPDESSDLDPTSQEGTAPTLHHGHHTGGQRRLGGRVRGRGAHTQSAVSCLLH
jgi:hypothetical protein